LPLRLFLGGTFAYAGIQKLTDPGFLHPGATTYIGTQLQGFANGTPGGFVIRTFALPHPVLAGVGVALLELAIGLFALLGLKTRLAAAAGMALNLMLFLTASWHTSPYFLGSDIIFVFAWLPFVLAGSKGQPSLDHVLERPSPALTRRVRLRPQLDPSGDPIAPSEASLTRRAIILEVGAAALAIGGLAAVAKGNYRAPPTIAGASVPKPATPPAQARPSKQPAVPSNAVKIGPSEGVSVGQPALYHDPADGSPDIVIRGDGGGLQAFSAVCTHAGCTVGYQNGQIVCPCHGAVYNPVSGAVEGGPAPAGLARKRVVEHGGSIYAVQA
jgi:thiosulfate dehydrogenase [quinone] large subunit